MRRTPWVTYALIAANVLVFLATPGVAGSVAGESSLSQLCHLQAFLEHYAAVPRELIHHQMPRVVPTGGIGVGTHGPGCIVAPPGYDKSPELSVFTAMFVHGSWLHLLGNMLFLWIFGNNIEDRMGHVRFFLFYVVCGYAAGYGFALLNADSSDPLIGASGAIAGVLGAYLVLYPRARVWVLVPFLIFLPLRLPAWIVLGFWFVLQAVYSSGQGVSQAGTVAYAAHVIGFLAGMLLALPLRPGTTPPPEPRGLIFGRRARPGWSGW
ncbi:hypothetical protein GCM10010389_28750 [Streptomyces echinoruber]|uniref:Peptidase S54 rhomboid domain-containing protein n=1 Tax=Streptomyces echinoruber TaxID=68898 RepID=A0A918R9I5_9ACTN|nr:hypothetical protein GCM10010389_28750 [Streptomyces echinoruber]